MAALETVEQEEWDADVLGRFISSSRSLKHVGGARRDEAWATAFEQMHAGSLRQLQSIGVVKLNSHLGIQRLQVALTSRGCVKSLNRLEVQIPGVLFDGDIGDLLAMDTLIDSCCESPDVVRTRGRLCSFELSHFYSDDFPAHASPFFKTAIKTAACCADEVIYTIGPNDFTHPIDTPSEAAIEIASSLSFDKVELVRVDNAIFFALPAGTGSPVPDIINHLPHFPRARVLHVNGRLGGAAGRLLAQKMPMEVVKVAFGRHVIAEDRRGVLEALGARRQMAKVCVGEDPWGAVDPFDGWGSNSLPAIHEMFLSVPNGLGDAAAANLIHEGLSTLLNGGMRGLRRVEVRVRLGVHDALGDAIQHGTSIGDFTIQHRRSGNSWLLTGCLSSHTQDNKTSP